ncbi:Crinkler (CRN) family protein [Phytophthora infestans T30-4]|uniref:Crinkler (CRN) family protein n=1 Tax=Phytophthora infestans (strain T30-4) TaxID=403677 RepID=D0N8I8_PHYIT|nr:Crinkler (CRN) family protein [Phytophthora infestans T30-4]EEY53873.1 Crinkler (CRN) family protein [Phytophthora infestans T30-4]|eukprot:XP_002904504.1 Crinkler (CRN) family protein [Phytophthora infestans T30-4]
MVKLVCAVVGVGSVFSVDIELSEMVSDLKEKIKEKKPGLIYFDADLLKLYLAREGDTWLYSRGADIKAVKAKKIPDRIKNLMQEHLLLDEACRLNNDEYFGDNLEQVDRDIHVLVDCPDEPDRVIKYKRKTGWIRWCFYGELVLMVLAVVFSAVVVYCGKGETRVRATTFTVADCVLASLIGVIGTRKQRIKSKIALAYRRWGYESIP